MWAQKYLEIIGNTNVYIAAMENPWTIRGQQVRLTRPELPWEVEGFLVNEGAAVLKKNGRIFITYSGSATDYRYCMGMLTASDTSDLLNPESWTKSPYCLFWSSTENGQFGPGHNSFTTNADDSVDLIVYHARPYRDTRGDPLHDPNRHARVQRVKWAEDGTPMFGVPVPDGPHTIANEPDHR